MKYTHLGIHSKYEICNGSRDFKDYINKAKFLGVDALGICDHNTLGGTLAFQQACQKAKINFALGETITVKAKQTYQLKLYVKSKVGWQNLLRINKAINVDNQGWIDEKELLERGGGLIAVIVPDSIDYFNKVNFYRISKQFKDIYFQFDCVEFKSNERDKEHILNLEKYLKELYHVCPPVIINDSYYLDKQDSHIKSKLNKIGKVSFSYASDDQHFKSIDEIFENVSSLFGQNDDRLYDIFTNGIDNAIEIANKCKFNIETGGLHLPKYIMNEDEKKSYNNTHDMFDDLVAGGLIRIGKEQDQQYLDRIKYETSVIDMGGYRDYFLITYDICKEADRRGITRNLGRGSAASSLCLYLMQVTMIDPIKYDLPFDRFLNSARVKKGLPDVDVDYASERREEIKQYVIQKYGYNHTAYIGTYGLLKVKSALKELMKDEGIDFKTANYITATFPKRVEDEPQTLSDLFKYCQDNTTLKKFIKQNVEITNDIEFANNSIKNKGIHAAGVVIFPQLDQDGKQMEVWDWVPVRAQDNYVVTEYAGAELDSMGFLKQDILGLSQLDKVGTMFDIIKRKHNKDYTFENIPLDDKKVFWMFNEGYTADVFQYSGSGMTAFLMDMKPDRLEDLIAANALHRPGAMGTGSHLRYIKVKNNEELPQYLWGLEEITKSTYSVLAYQEQVIKACVDIGGLSLAEGDMIRKGIGKKDKPLLESYKPKFIEGAVAKGCPQDQAQQMWSLFESFGEYAFNRSHSACYSILGYITMYIKTYYPLIFYTTSLHFVKDDERPHIIAEINRLKQVKVVQPDINRSTAQFEPDFDSNKIYWSLTSTKWVGDSAVQHILQKREQGGKFFSIKDLCERVDKRTVNKRSVTNLIVGGAFDEIYNVQRESDRLAILKGYYQDILDEELPQQFKDNENIYKDYWWILQALHLTGFGYIDYKDLLQLTHFDGQQDSLINTLRFQQEESIGQQVVMCGVIDAVIERRSKKGAFVQININHNAEIYYFTMWNEQYVGCRNKLKDSEGKICFLTGSIVFDRYKKINVVHSNDDTILQLL